MKIEPIYLDILSLTLFQCLKAQGNRSEGAELQQESSASPTMVWLFQHDSSLAASCCICNNSETSRNYNIQITTSYQRLRCSPSARVLSFSFQFIAESISDYVIISSRLEIIQKEVCSRIFCSSPLVNYYYYYYFFRHSFWKMALQMTFAGPKLMCGFCLVGKK